jgi:lycopene beta-cyclase
MAKGKRDGLLIVGGGLAGCIAALAMAKLRPEVPFLLVEERDHFGGDHLWSFLDREVDAEQRWLIDPLVSMNWDSLYVSFPEFSRKLRLGYSSIASDQLDRVMRETLRPDQYLLNTKAVAVRETELVLPGGEKIRADGAIDARGAANLSMIEVGWHKFVAREFEFPRPHRVDLPVLIDATIDQIEGYHYAYCLPLSETRLRVEDVHYSETSELDRAAINARILAYLELRGWRGGVAGREESGVLPVPLSDDVHAFWRGAAARVAKIGPRGGFFHPANGHAIADAVHTALLLADQRYFDGAALHDLFQAEAAQLWRKRDFYRGFNAAIFDATILERRRIMENFYRLDSELIARFHAGRMGMMDRRKVSATTVVKPGR